MTRKSQTMNESKKYVGIDISKESLEISALEGAKECP